MLTKDMTYCKEGKPGTETNRHTYNWEELEARAVRL